jgi:hypothetical protein
MSTIETIQDGYPGLARLMGQGFGIFKKFSQLNAQNLLYMQAELLGLEHELNITTHFDDKEAATMTFARSVWDMRRAEYSTQWAKILEIREKLQVYSETCRPQLTCLLNHFRSVSARANQDSEDGQGEQARSEVTDSVARASGRGQRVS